MYPKYPSLNTNYNNNNTNRNQSRNYFTTSEQRMPAFQQYIRRYEINPTFAKKLLALDGYEIVFICDDSGSMNTPLGDVYGPYKNAATRWDELKQTVSVVVDLASLLDPNGVDIYFLNRDPIFNVRHSSELIPIFTVPPEVLRSKQNEIQERKLLIFIATDGTPTNDEGYQDSLSLENVLKNERHPINRIPVSIIACTDDEQDMDYLNEWDTKIPNLDVVDDYRSEKREILKCQGTDFPFSFGDYIVKILLGAVDQTIDEWDEKKITPYDNGRW
ncbi:unnamed protein product [Rotaria magnacalcarata]|uniref:VWFA domain-containing protein n=1 Tax=Rotaria magnacalcarata TaxID=392030 RepID=A0A819KB33_9BILA|nr:unnamed protein product [Rotaria magnacalcarata]CAF3946585.1 unnamed protein product [Rotaria magnacalcarata]